MSDTNKALSMTENQSLFWHIKSQHDGSARQGYECLWAWFGLSRASWLTMPRVLMHEMPDDWQLKMSQLCFEWDEHWKDTGDATPYVSLKKGGRFVKVPHWLTNYRRPDKSMIQKCRGDV